MKKSLFGCTAVLLLAGCSSLEDHAIGGASQFYGLRMETAGSATSGTVLPNLLFGTIQSSVVSAPKIKKEEATQVTLSYTESSSLLGEVFGLDVKTRTFSYIGLPGESAEQTKVRLEAVANVLAGKSETK